jgi:hypothetical protein
VNIRPYQPGDEVAQAAIYNEATAEFPRYKPATAEEILRRVRARDFDPSTRLYAEADGQIIGYANFHSTGRVGHPWCRKGHERAADPLFEQVLRTMKDRGIRTAFAAYRGDWPVTTDFFVRHGFELTREMVNFVLDQSDMPTRPGRRLNPLTPLRREDVPAVFEMGAGIIRSFSPAELEKHLFHNPYFGPESLFAIRNRADQSPLGVGILVANLTYADPTQVDARMPCFRLGAFGAEGLTTKRINGLFSILTDNRRDISPVALDLMGHASFQFDEAGGGSTSLAAQVPSDAAHLLRFYQSYFRKQGSFPIFERAL